MSEEDFDFVHREPVRWADLDAFHHLNNVVFQRYFETAFTEYRSKLGFMGDPFAPDFFGFVMAEFHINYRAPVRFDEALDIGLTVAEVGRSSLRIAFEMRVGERLCADGYGVYVGFDNQQQRVAPVPDDFRARLEGGS